MVSPLSNQINAPHWRYFQLLERDLAECFRYVHPSTVHLGVYSEHFARIILMASTEIENCIRGYADFVGHSPMPGKIGEYQAFINGQHANFNKSKVLLPEYSLDFEPWKGWTASNPPDWWTYGYNKIKHDRLGYPDAPTLKRATESVGGLFILLLHYYSSLNSQCCLPMDRAPSVFDLEAAPEDYESGCVFWSWNLP